MIVDGRPIALVERGEGPPAVLVHASSMSGAQWGLVAPKLAARYRLLVPDLLGYGGSAPWPDRDTFDLAADVAVVSAVIARAGAPVHLVGHSYGGLLAMHAAAAAPERIRSLAVYEPVAFGVLHGTDADALASLGTEDDTYFVDPATGGDERWMELFINYWSGPGAWARLPEPRRAAMTASGRKSFLEVRALLADHTPASHWAAIGRRTLLLSGTRSPRAARAVCAVLAAAIPEARHVVFDGAGHMAPVEEPRRFLQAIEPWFAEG